MNSILCVVLILFCSAVRAADPAPPIIDMHVHASSVSQFEQLLGPAPIPHCVPMTDYPPPESGSKFPEIIRSRANKCNATWSPLTNAEVMEKSLSIMKKRNIFGVTNGTQLAQWVSTAPDRVIPSEAFGDASKEHSIQALRESFRAGKFRVFGEVAVQYVGMTPDDPSITDHWALAEELDVPVGIHIGTGPVGAPYIGFDRYRARLHSALLLEEVLIKHPRLRVYIMHAGWPMLDDLLAVLWTHPQVYVDTGVIAWALPRAEFHRYLQRIVEAGFGERVMFGSDQMIWPDTMEMAIESIESADFLSPEQKRDIFFNNAARFLRLTQQQIEAMQHPER